MAKARYPVVPFALQPKPSDYPYDLDLALAPVVVLKALVPDDAFTAGTLGTERIGHGTVIGEDGLILTMGYLIIEAETIWLQTIDGRFIQGHALAYDVETGFGLVQALAPLDLPKLALGSAKLLAPGDHLVVAGGGGRERAIRSQLVSAQEFAGYWEYYLSEALFIAPAHPFWGGAAVIDERGLLVGLCSLQIEQTQRDAGPEKLNMVVPVDIILPILDDLVQNGRSSKPARPWLGVYATEVGSRIVIAGVADGGPAEKGGLESGDIIIAVNDERPKSLAELWHRIWSMGPPGVAVSMLIEREAKIIAVRIVSVDRMQFTRSPVLH